MKPLLAIECATDIGSVAVGSPGRVRVEALIGPRQHASGLLPTIRTTLDAAGVTFAELGGIVVSDGPGSFTGLRIGAATALGIAHAHPDLGLWTAPSLLGAALVGHRLGFSTVAVLYDALRGEVFQAVCRTDGGRFEVLDPPRLTVPYELESGDLTPDVTLGDGACAHADAMRRWSGRDPLPPESTGPRASALIELTRMPEHVTRVHEPHALSLNYGRQAEAQVKWEQRHGRPLPDSTRHLG